MSINIGVNASAAAATTSATTGALTSQVSGSIFVVGVQSFDNTPISTPTDSKSNAYVPIEAEQTYLSSHQRCRWYYIENGVGGSGHTFSGSSAGAAVVNVYAVEITGALISGSLDQHNLVHDAVTPFVSPSITPTVPASLVLTFFAGGGSGTSTHAESQGFTILSNTDQSNGTSFNTGCMAYKILASAVAINSSFTESTNAGDSVIFIADFKELAAVMGQTLMGQACL